MIIVTFDATSQELKGRIWVTEDHQTMKFFDDTVMFFNGGREEVFNYSLNGYKLSLFGSKDLVFRATVTFDSLVLSEWFVEGGLKRNSKNGDDVIFRRSMKLSDYDSLAFADATSLMKKFDQFESVRFQSSACMGSCPMLDITIKSNREVEFKGEAHATHEGNFSGKLDKSLMQEICTLVKTGDLKGLKSRLKTPLDFPTYTLTINYGAEVSSYTGYSFYTPLNQLVKQFLDFDTTLKLKKLE